MSFFEWQLQSLAPAEFEVIREFTIDIDRQNRPEPDVIVVRGDVVDDPEQTRYPAEVTLAVEVVSPESVSRDRETKPLKYARAGIAHYWRVENEKGLAVVHAFELDPTTGAYTSVGIFRERMKTSAPFPVDLDLTAIKPRRAGEESGTHGRGPAPLRTGRRTTAVKPRSRERGVSARTPPPDPPGPGSTAAPRRAPPSPPRPRRSPSSSAGTAPRPSGPPGAAR
ncbi:hypothetical protein SUDANB43_04063 [Streptomyces sp. enrichment culture]